jgi:ABC-type phosphate transport system substrate-binding protein
MHHEWTLRCSMRWDLGNGCTCGNRFPIFSKWAKLAALEAREHKLDVTFAYQGVGSTEGQLRLAKGDVSFAVIDSGVFPERLQELRDAWLVPVLAGAVAVGFNVPDLEFLLLSREQLALIFLGRIQQWSELAHSNPSLKDKHERISLVLQERPDQSGTTKAFTRALSSFSSEWRGKMGASSRPKWPTKIERNRTATATTAKQPNGFPDVAFQILGNPYSLGFLPQMDAMSHNVRMANISNHAGEFLAPSQRSVQAAINAAEATFEESVQKKRQQILDLDIIDPKMPSSENELLSPEAFPEAFHAYPISVLTFVLFDPAKLTCRQLGDVIYQIYWAWTSERAASVAIDEGAYPIAMSGGSRLRDSILIPALSKLTCQGQMVLGDVVRKLAQCDPGANRRAPHANQETWAVRVTNCCDLRREYPEHYQPCKARVR